MPNLPDPISRQDKLLHNIADGTPNIEDLTPISREEKYLKHIALNTFQISQTTGQSATAVMSQKATTDAINATVPISRGGTGGTTESEARTNLEVLKAYILYNNDAGNEGTITLNDNADNYEFLDIIIWDFYVGRIYSRNNRPVGLMKIGGYGKNFVEWYSETITIKRNIITRPGCTYAILKSDNSLQFIYTKRIPIRSVIGYKY